jgi:HEAT repeat protein
MGREEGRKSIRDVLINAREERANALGARLKTVWNTAENKILEAQKSPDGHAAGPLHVRKVEENLSRLIPDSWKKREVNATELFILSAASCLHDTGKVDPSTNDHGETGADHIRKNASVYGLNDEQADWISQIVRIHTKREELNELEQILHRSGDEIHLRDLAALFCLADTLHCTSDRVLLCADKNHPKTKLRMQISDWFLDEQDDSCIRLEAHAKDPADIECLREGLELIRRYELSPIALQLKTTGYPWQIDFKIIYDPKFLENMLKGKSLTRVRETPGLGFYTENDREEFKGRKQDTEKIWANVLATKAAKNILPISLLSGKSGVGKTSLIRAGLFPVLKETGWQMAHCRISSHDLVNQIVTDLWHDLLLRDELPPTGFSNAIKQVCEKNRDAKTLIVLDQFEQIVRVPIENIEDLKIGILQIMARKFPNLHLLLAYQTETHDEVISFLTSMSERVWHSPTHSLLPLSREGAKEALETLFASAQVGLDLNTSIIDIIVNDITAQGQGFYPPFLQIVAKTLSDSAKLQNGFVTLGLYNELGGTEKIIGTFLMNRLNTFSGQKRELAETILKALVGAGGSMRQKSFAELQQETKMDESLLREILRELERERLILPTTGDKYEIIHSYLAQLVDQQLDEGTRELKRLREHLSLKSREFESTKGLLLMTELAQLYRLREHITPDRQEARLLLHCSLAGYGPGWYWIRNYTAEECTPFVVDALSHPYEPIRKNAIELIAVLKGNNALPDLKKMLGDPRSPVREAAIWAIANLGIVEAVPDIRRMLSDDNWAVCEAAIRALGKLQAHDASGEIERLLYDKYWQVRRAVVEVLAQLIGPEILKKWVQHPHWQIKAPAVKCLSELEGEKSLSWLRSMLRDEKDWAVRTEVILALTKLRDEESLEQLKLIATCEKDWKVKEAAIEASILLEGEHALETAKMLLHNQDQYKRKIAVKLVGQLGGKNDAPLIAGLLRDRWDIVRIAAVNALTKIDGEKSLDRFFKMLKGDNEDVRKAVARGIAKLGSEREALELAKRIASFKFGDWAREANEALVLLDRKLYCPFESQLKALIESKVAPR